jgi:hypothetical protein
VATGVAARAGAGTYRRRRATDRTCDVAQDTLSYVALLAAQCLDGQALAVRVDAACAVLPFPAGTVCRRFVGESLAEVAAALRAGKRPLEVAAALGLCSRTARRRPARALMVPTRRATADIACDGCVAAVALIEVLAREDVVEEDLVALVETVCEALPFPIGALCASVVDGGIEEVIAEVERGTDALGICGAVGLCAANANANARARAKANAGVPKGKAVLRSIPGDIFCDVCTDVVNYISDLIINGTIEPEIKALVEQFCDIFPWPVSSFCISFVDEYVDEIIADIEAGVTDICSIIGLCANPPPSEYKRLMQIRTNGAARRPRVASRKGK